MPQKIYLYQLSANNFHKNSKLSENVFTKIEKTSKKGFYNFYQTFDSTEMDCRELKSFGYYMKNYGFNAKVECGKNKHSLYIDWSQNNVFESWL